MKIKTIKTEPEYSSALKRLYNLINDNVADNSDEYHEIEILIVLIKDYEDIHHQVLPPDPGFPAKY